MPPGNQRTEPEVEGYTFTDTTADVGLAVQGGDLRTLFKNAFHGTLHLSQGHPLRVTEPAGGDSVRISFSGDSYENLLVQLLSEVIFLLETRPGSLTALEIEQLNPRLLTGRIRISSHPRSLCQSLKAVTYHRLEIIPDPAGGYRTRIIFDI
jgi:SHS2 domain-containing protein